MPPRPTPYRLASALLAALALLPLPMTAATVFFGNYADSIRAADFD
ncbi:MAG: hypothetical protein RLZZ50_1104, partial [Verrucomicrobiota bacterium]